MARRFMQKVRLGAVMRLQTVIHSFIASSTTGEKPSRLYHKTDDVVWIYIAALSSLQGYLSQYVRFPLPMIIPRLNLRNPLTQHAVKLTIRVSRFTSHQQRCFQRFNYPSIPAFGSALAYWTKHLLYILPSLKRWKILDLYGSRKKNGGSVI